MKLFLFKKIDRYMHTHILIYAYIHTGQTIRKILQKIKKEFCNNVVDL